ncbi:hypothetical protein HMPREF0290_2997 [Corynebacterium efficiens YS-314]|nr:hypothetical protein HMPREF0290_2997 [Corynebacterium efficiens YS-314]
MEEILGSPLDRDHKESRTGDVRDSQAANDQLISLFPEINPVGLSEGIAKTIEWFRKK